MVVRFEVGKSTDSICYRYRSNRRFYRYVGSRGRESKFFPGPSSGEACCALSITNLDRVIIVAIDRGAREQCDILDAKFKKEDF